MTTPTCLEFTKTGFNHEQFAQSFIDGINQFGTPKWAIRWRGRLRAINGMGWVGSREQIKQNAITWLRDCVRRKMQRECIALADSYRPGPADGIRLNKSFPYTKQFRIYVDQLEEYLVSNGTLEYVELEPRLDVSKTGAMTNEH